MTGEELHRRVRASGISVEEAMKGFNLSRQGLYDLYKKDDIGDKYRIKAEKLGLTKIDFGNESVVPFSANQLFSMWESSEKERRTVSDALYKLLETHNKMLDTHQQVLKKKLNIG